MAVTIKDVAKAAGVSHTTVSRALRGNPAISITTTETIKRLALEMGYVPNHVARGLKMNRSGALGVIVRRVDDPFFGQVLNGIEDVLQSAGYSLFLAASNNDPTKDQEIIQSLAERRVDGVIICSTRISQAHRQQLSAFGMPTVLINNQATEEAEHAIYHDDAHGSRVLTEHLIELGHTHIAYIGNENAGVTDHQRQLGYQMALTQAGMIVNRDCIILAGNGRPEAGSFAAEQLISLPTMPTAVVCFNDMVAMGAIHTLTAHGFNVPNDCSVTGFDNVGLAAYVIPALTTFKQPMYELGQESAKMMLRLLDKPDDEQFASVQLRGELLVRQSTAAPKV